MFSICALLLFVYLFSSNAHASKTDDSEGGELLEPINNLKLHKHNDTYYYFGVIFKGNFFKAIQTCHYQNMKLVSIETSEENEFLYTTIHKSLNLTGDHDFWSSGTRLPDEKASFVWLSTGIPFSYTNWSPGQPDYTSNFLNGYSELCVNLMYSPTLTWNDNNCGHQMFFICESTLDKTVHIYIHS